ncbi:hypothetical protein BBF96_04410 [Anoxybacter fermentans]|uniref:RND efflux pump membrane fusion protein barrel-sandwich domain-containing protein n=1 Tax=Anoxybacter fermentans TaxID=1323375 RepID=A0A3S9SWM6_9FIRM|nr:efflux RND transporter periplasmic adaptor subunit [Anoxybacter fermentans]AZR72699.1 hypothetical protein BBF96_04410 [Anoxybacter fermentans]
MGNKIWILLLIIILISGVVTANDQSIPVKVIEAVSGTIEVNKIVNGVIEPYKNINVSSKTGGIVEEVRVQVGQYVRAGEILVVFEQDQIKAQLKQAKAALELARANLAMVQKGASEEELQQVQASYDQALASYEAAKRNLEVAQSMYEDRTVQKQQLVAAKTQLEVAEKQLEMAEERFNQAKIALDVAKTDYERMTVLFEKRVITQKQYEGVESQYKNAQSAFNSAKLAKEQALISYEGAKENYQLAKDIYENRTTAQQQVDGAKTQLEIAKANLKIAEANLQKVIKGASAEQIRASQASVKQAEAALELVRLQLENSVIKSPIDGIIAQVNVDPGEMVGPGVSILTIINIDKVYVKADVTADVLKFLQVGDTVKVKVLVYPEDLIEGKIELISPMADPRTQAYPVKVLLDNESQQLKPGMFADLILTLEKSTDTIVLPVEAVLELEDLPYIYVVKISSESQVGRTEKRMIKVGLVNDHKVEVIEGLQPGEKVVIMGQHRLQDGNLVEVIEK